MTTTYMLLKIVDAHTHDWVKLQDVVYALHIGDLSGLFPSNVEMVG